MKAPMMFIPRALSKAWTKREGYLVRDLTMPERDWSQFDEPTYLRRGKKVKVEFLPPMLLRRQAA